MVLAGTYEPTDPTGNIYSSYVEVTTASTTISAIQNNKYIREKNSEQQTPLVRLYTVYYPGEWYPPNARGNPSGEGAGYAWPAGFPFRVAEIRADLITDNEYTISMGGANYTPYPINSGSISVDTTGKIGDVSVSFSNWDNVLTGYLEDPYLVGNNESNAISAIVNGETVYNIDPKTVPTNTSGNPYNLHYDSTYATNRGGINLAYDYGSTEDVRGTWTAKKLDTRDLLGGIVEIKSTFAKFLDVWPEYSKSTGSVVTTHIPIRTTLPYRVGDLICNSTAEGTTTYTVTQVNLSNIVVSSATGLSAAFPAGSRVYISNPDRDPDAYTIDKFKIDSLTNLDERFATFSLANWLQYFRLQLPKRKYYKNTCPWIYKGPECRYPASGTGEIPGTATLKEDGTLLADAAQANGYFTVRNETTTVATQDICSKTLQACRLRNNEVHFGGFPGVNLNRPR